MPEKALPPTDPHLLYVRAGTDRTHVGGSFCSGEERLRGYFEDIDAVKSLAISGAQNDVAAGVSPAAAMEVLDGQGVFGLRSKAMPRIMLQCLLTIERGGCRAHPRSYGAESAS